MESLSRVETILGGDTTVMPQSRVEYLLIELIEEVKSGGASEEQIQRAVNNYLETHPIASATDAEIKEYLNIQEVNNG